MNAVNDINLAAGNVVNSGVLTTGAVFLATLPDMSNVVNLNGLESGVKIANVNGNIEIVAVNNVENSGKIAADGATNLNAGNISVTAGNDIQLQSGSVISARGNGSNSSGGTINLMAGNDASVTNGKIDASAGAISGDGGAIHFSGKEEVNIQGASMIAGAKNGHAGSVLIDPATINWTGSSNDVFQTDGTSYTLTADQAITLNDVVISTRQVASSKANRSDIETAASIGGSGNITLKAPNITLGAGTKLLAYADNSYTSGDITLEAKDTATSGYFGAKSATASIQIGDDTGGATLNGGDIDIHAVAIAENGIILPNPDNLGDTVAITTTLLADLPSLLSDFTGSNVIYSSAEATATVTVKQGSVLTADKTIDISAKTLAESGSKPFDIPLLDLYVRTDVPLAVGILYANLDALATVTVENGATINAKDLNITAHNEATLDAAIAAEPPAATGTATVSLAVGLSLVDVASTIDVGGELNVSDNIQIAATNKGSYSTEVSAKSGTDGVAAGAVVLSFRDTSATANLTADVTDAAKLGVYAVNNITEDVVDVSTKSGTTTLTDIVNKLEMNVTDTVQSPIYGCWG